MTAKERKELWLKFHRFQMREEIKYTKEFNKVLKAQIQTYIKHRDTVYIRSGDMYVELMRLHMNVAPAWAKQSIALRKKRGGQMGFSEMIVSFIRQYFKDRLLAVAENITQTTIDTIRKVLTEAQINGDSFDQIVKKLLSPSMTSIRARLIARTETVGAANAGSLIAAQQTGDNYNKVWISARDNRTRLHHQEVDNAVVPRDGKFKVGDSLMEYPGDKAGSAQEVCNCRCALGFERVG